MTYDSAEKYEELYFKRDNCCELGKLKVRCVSIGLIKKKTDNEESRLLCNSSQLTFSTLNVDIETFVISQKGTHPLK